MKMSPRTDLAHLEHIRGRIARIEDFTNRERPRFYDSHLVQDAVESRGSAPTVAGGSNRLPTGFRIAPVPQSPA